MKYTIIQRPNILHEAICCAAIRERRKREASFRVVIPTTVTPIGKRRVG